MAPRRGGSGYSSYSSYGDSRWNNEIWFSKDDLISPSNFIAGFAFDVLTLAALIAFIVWACTIRNHRGQLKCVLGALFSWLLSVALYMIPKIFYLADATVTYYYVIDLMLGEFFYLLTECLLVFVFFNLIHGLLERLTDSGKPYAPVKIVHWVILGILAILSMADWGVFVAKHVATVNVESNYLELWQTALNLDASRSIILWVISLEILAWAIFVIVKAGSHRFASKVRRLSRHPSKSPKLTAFAQLPPIALVVGSVFWVALSLMYVVIAIHYGLEQRRTPWTIDTSRSICRFFFCVGTSVGILLCCMSWRKLGDDDKPPTVTQTGGPGQPYQTWEQYPQQYPQQQYAPYPPQQQPVAQPYQYPQVQPQPQAQVPAQPQPQQQ